MTSAAKVMADDLWDFSASVLGKMDLPRDHAEIVSTALVDADLRGVETHGTARLPQYAGLIKNGTINPRPDVKIIAESAIHSLWDNGFGLGFIGSVRAMALCVEKARREGISVAGVRNSSHFGAAGYYALLAAEQGLIGFAASNTYPIMAPPGTLTATHGNNPLAYAFPAGKKPPVVIDMATSVSSQGRIKKMGSEGLRIPSGWAFDREGNPTDDPDSFFLLAPFGEGGYKGFGLAIAVDALAGILTGSLFSRQIISGPGSRGCGHFFLALDPEVFLPLENFRKKMDEVVGTVKGARLRDPVGQPVSLPGERGWREKKKRLREGIPLKATALEALDRLSGDLGVDPLRRK
jgi:L-2-hydroxycarboxylate dehydrogenase (NAD+)